MKKPLKRIDSISEITAAKRALEQCVSAHIVEFEERTGFSISGIDVGYTHRADLSIRTIHVSVSIDLQI